VVEGSYDEPISRGGGESRVVEEPAETTIPQVFALPNTNLI
jgi:hypothetical protein